MKKLYTLLLAAGLAASAQAQITFTMSSFNHANVTDTFMQITADRPVLEPSTTSQFFDFNFVGYGNTRYYSLQDVGTNPAFPDATFWENRGYQQGADSFLSKRWSGVTASGITRFGESIERQVVRLNGVPGGTANDSLVILAQDAAYSTPYKLIPFPSTYGDSWNSDFYYEVNMELTLGSTYQQAEFKQKTSVSYDFDAVGFGHFEMIKWDNGFGQAEVLMVRVASETVDSFFVNGAPAPTGLLTTLGLTQDRHSKIYFDELFREQEVNPLVLYNYGNDATYTNVTSNQVHQDRLAFAANVSELTRAPYADGNEAKLFPNIWNTTTSAATLYLPAATAGTYTYSIANIEGKIIYKAKRDIETNGKAQLNITLPEGMVNGAYWLKLQNANGKEITVQPLRYMAE